MQCADEAYDGCLIAVQYQTCTLLVPVWVSGLLVGHTWQQVEALVAWQAGAVLLAASAIYFVLISSAGLICFR